MNAASAIIEGLPEGSIRAIDLHLLSTLQTLHTNLFLPPFPQLSRCSCQRFPSTFLVVLYTVKYLMQLLAMYGEPPWLCRLACTQV